MINLKQLQLGGNKFVLSFEHNLDHYLKIVKISKY